MMPAKPSRNRLPKSDRQGEHRKKGVSDGPFLLFTPMKTPFLCRLGLHQWFGDGAMFSHADCCNRCGKYSDQAERNRLMRERDLWTEASTKNLSTSESMHYVLSRLNEARVNEQLRGHNDK